MDFDFSSLTGSLGVSATNIASGNVSSADLSNISTVATNNGFQLGGLGEGVTIGRAVLGDPTAIMSLVSDPSKVIDFAKNYNPISVTADLGSILSAHGVDASFFDKFPFLKFLDNSTGHWKSRQGPLRGMTPEQRLCWYLKPIQDGSFGFDDTVQYMEFCAPKEWGSNKTIQDDTPKLPYELAATWNAVIKEKIYKNQPTYIWNDGNGHHEKPLSWLSIDVTKTKDFATVVDNIKTQATAAAKQKQQESILNKLATQSASEPTNSNSTPDSGNKTYIIIGAIAAVAIIVALILKK